MEKRDLPLNFVFRRVQSLTGFFLTLFLIEHFFTNSLAAYFFNNGYFFIKMVNLLQTVPHLHFIEISLIATPIMLHLIWGMKYLTSASDNFKKTDGTKPSLRLKKNKAYVLQRASAIIIGVFLIFHVAEMRFINAPKKINVNNENYFLVKIKGNKKSISLINKLNGSFFTKNQILNLKNENLKTELSKFKLKKNQIIAMTKKSGEAFLLVVRNILQKPLMAFLYTLFILSASFHALNGFWTFLLSWGFIISKRAQIFSWKVCFFLMFCVVSLGLIAIYGNFFS